MNDEARSWFPAESRVAMTMPLLTGGGPLGSDHGSNWGWSESADQGPSPRGSTFPRARRPESS